MLTHLQVGNFRSLASRVEFTPGPLSVIVGPNGAGKSNVLDALSFVSEAVLTGLPSAVTSRGGIECVRRRSGGRPFNVKFDLRFSIEGEPARYRFELTGDAHGEYLVKSEEANVRFEGETVEFRRSADGFEGPEGLAPRTDLQSLVLTALAGDRRFKPLTNHLAAMRVYSIFPDTLRKPQTFDPTSPMRSHGENWVSTLKALLDRPADRKDLIDALERTTGDIEDLRVKSAAGFLVAEFKQPTPAGKRKAPLWMGSLQQSDGTLRVAGILTALLQEPPLSVIGIEEPELTVHPGIIPLLMDYLRQASERSQVILTTHSPILLDLLNVEHDHLFVAGRRGGITRLERVSDATLAPVRQDLLRLRDLFEAGELQIQLPLEPEDGEER